MLPAACFMCGGTGRCQPHNDYCFGPDGEHPATCDDRCKFCQPAHDPITWDPEPWGDCDLFVADGHVEVRGVVEVLRLVRAIGEWTCWPVLAVREAAWHHGWEVQVPPVDARDDVWVTNVVWTDDGSCPPGTVPIRPVTICQVCPR